MCIKVKTIEEPRTVAYLPVLFLIFLTYSNTKPAKNPNITLGKTEITRAQSTIYIAPLDEFFDADEVHLIKDIMPNINPYNQPRLIPPK